MLCQYPAEKINKLVYDMSFYVLLISIFSLSKPSSSNVLTLLEVIKYYCSGLMASMELGFGYLGFQPDPSISEWILQVGIPAIKEEFSQEVWEGWFKKARQLCSILKAKKQSATSGEVSSSGHKKKKPSK